MNVKLVFVACCLSGQTAALALAAAPLVPVKPRGSSSQANQSPSSRAAGSGTRTVPGTSSNQSEEASESLAERLLSELVSAHDAGLEGEPAGLVDVLSDSFDRQRRLEVTRAYWRLSLALGHRQVAMDEVDRLGAFVPEVSQPTVRGQHAGGAPGDDPPDPATQAAYALAQSRRREADLRVIVAQHELAALAGWADDRPLPLPSDVPHATGYLTRFAEIYRQASAPSRAWLIDRTLPVRRKLLDARAKAIQAAADAVKGLENPNTSDLPLAVDCVLELGRQREAFLAAVHAYNDEIAEYALSIAPEGMTSANLVSLLIKTATVETAEADDPDGDAGSEVERATFEQDVPDGSQSDGDQSDGDQPDGDDAGDEAEASDDEQPTLAPPRNAADADDQSGARPGPKTHPRLLLAAWQSTRSRIKSQVDEAAEPVGLYPALVELAPARRAQQLSLALHWGHEANGAARSFTLAQCLRSVPEADRFETISAYWESRETIARKQVASQRVEQLTALVPEALKKRKASGGAHAMLRLRREQLTAEADDLDAQIEVLAAQWKLLVACGRSLSGEWPSPTTVPHAGGYRVKLSQQSPHLAQSLSIRRLAGAIGAQHAVLTERAAAVIDADVARARATARFASGEVSIDEPLRAVKGQVDETLTFLADQSEYNQRLARYALSVLPSGAPLNTVVSALVLDRPQKSAP